MKADESANLENLEQVDLKIAALHSLLGERFENFGTPTAFGALAQVMDQFEELARGMETELHWLLEPLESEQPERYSSVSFTASLADKGRYRRPILR